MTEQPVHQSPPAHEPSAANLGNPLKDAAAMIEMIARATGQPREDVARRLRSEYERPGSTVADDFRRRGLEPYVYSEGMERFYSESDSFIYESAMWNRNRIKHAMRRWTGRCLDRIGAERGGEPLKVLSIGDGLGFDSAYIARSGHDVTYHEVSGPTEAMARQVFAQSGRDVRVETDFTNIPTEAFDAVVCLDVLEHVPVPPTFVRSLSTFLKPGGVLIVHAPFYMIHRAYPTHLRCNRAHSGSLKLYTSSGLRLVHGKLGWNPIVLQRPSPNQPALHLRGSSLKRAAIRLAGLYLALGRFSTLPLLPVHGYRLFHNRWFAE